MPRKTKAQEIDTSMGYEIDVVKEALLKSALSDPTKRTSEVNEITSRITRLRASKVSDDVIAQAEAISLDLMQEWMRSPHRTPTQDECRRMLEHDIPALAAENLTNLLRDGSVRATLQVVASSKMMAPKKAAPSKTSVIVAVGKDPVGADPLERVS